MRPGRELLSILDAVLIVSPTILYLGKRVPVTLAITGPEWKPTRISTQPLVGSSRSINVSLATSTVLFQHNAAD